MGVHQPTGWSESAGDSWKPVDLSNYLEEQDDGSLIEAPSTEILVRADGHGLLDPGRTDDLHGPPESGKSWVALLAVGTPLGWRPGVVPGLRGRRPERSWTGCGGWAFPLTPSWRA